MNLDKYLSSQTFKTGMFVVVVLLVFLIVFKLGVVHGHKKAIHSQRSGQNFSQTYGGTSFFGHYRGTFNKDMHGGFLLKKQLIKDKIILDSKVDEESETVDSTQ